MSNRMSDDEIFKKYNRAGNAREKKEQITIIAELNGMTNDEVRKILAEKGAELPNERRKTSPVKAKSEPVKKTEKGSKKQQDIQDSVRNVIVKGMQDLTDKAEQLHKELDEIIAGKVEPLEKAIDAIEKEITDCSNYLRGE